MGLPNFIIPGFQKCGTTALWLNLKQHPKLNTTEHKELDFFMSNRVTRFRNKINLPKFENAGSKAAYKGMFKSNPGELWFECSPNYSNNTYKSTLQNILSVYDNVNDIKLIFSVRDPVSRAFSAYNHYRQQEPISRDWGWDSSKGFLWNTENNNAFHSVYADVITHYAEFIPKSNIHVVVQEWMVSNPEREYNKIFDFLGVPRVGIENHKVHNRDYPKTRYLRKDAEAALTKHYAPLNQALFEFIGYEIPEWRSATS